MIDSNRGGCAGVDGRSLITQIIHADKLYPRSCWEMLQVAIIDSRPKICGEVTDDALALVPSRLTDILSLSDCSREYLSDLHLTLLEYSRRRFKSWSPLGEVIIEVRIVWTSS